jgi:NADPH:quinone reductase-like Zn-dependent oxidoreductase
MPDPHPAGGEVRIRVAASGINPGDLKKRQNAFGYGMAYPRVIPHSDGAGQVDEIGEGVLSEWLGQSVWCYGAQSYPWIKWLACPRACRWSRAPAWGYPASPHTAPSMLPAP